MASEARADGLLSDPELRETVTQLRSTYEAQLRAAGVDPATQPFVDENDEEEDEEEEEEEDEGEHGDGQQARSRGREALQGGVGHRRLHAVPLLRSCRY